MATLLLIIIYLGYIGLGLPDSLFGTAWPLMHEELGVPVWLAGYITPIMSVFTIISSLFSGRLLNRFGTGKVAAVSTILTVLALFGYSISPNIFVLLLCAIPLGFGAGAVDAGMNGYIARHYNAMHMNFLHCFYGIGITISPFIMSIALEKLGSWRMGYRAAGVIQIVIAVCMCAAVPLWGRVKHKNEENIVETEVRNVPIRELAKDPAVRWVWLCFFTSCGLESMCNTWASSYLVNSKGITADDAARMLVFYYIGFTFGRFIAGLLTTRLTSWQIIYASYGILALAVVLLILPLPEIALTAALFCIGLGNSPVYPNLMHLTPRNFGMDISQSVIGSQMAVANISFMIIPLTYGQIVKVTGLGSFTVVIPVLAALLILSTSMLYKRVNKGK